MFRQTASITIAAANAAAVAASQTPSAGALTLTASSVVLDVARRVLATTTGNETGKTMTISGTDRAGGAITETLSLPNAGTVQSVQDFAKVSAATISANAAAALTVGTSTVASTKWLPLSRAASNFDTGIQVNLGGVTANVTVEATLDVVDMAQFMLENPGIAFTPPTAMPLTGMTAATADFLQMLDVPCVAVRMTVNSGATTAGTRITVIQTGIA